MKKIFLLLTFILLSIAGFSQGFKTGGIFLRVTDSATYVNSAYVTAAHADNYADIIYSVASGLFWKWNGSAYEQLGSGGAGGHTIEEEGTPLTARSKLNFVGAGVTATDDSGDDASVITIPNPTINTSTSLTDGAAITITGTKHTLTSTQATVTWTLSQTGDFQTTDIILNATTTTWTFPANTLCVYEGVASGDNTAVLSGTSGDHYIMSTYKDGTNYRVVIKNFGQ